MEWLYGASESSNMEVDIGYIPQVSAQMAPPTEEEGGAQLQGCHQASLPSWRGDSGKSRMQDRAPGRLSPTVPNAGFWEAPRSCTQHLPWPSDSFPQWKAPWVGPGSVPDSLPFPGPQSPHLCSEWGIFEGLSGPISVTSLTDVIPH